MCYSASSCWPVVSPSLFFPGLRLAHFPVSLSLSFPDSPCLLLRGREGGRRGCDPIELSAISPSPSPEPKSGATYDVFPEVKEKENEKKVSPFLSFSFFLLPERRENERPVVHGHPQPLPAAGDSGGLRGQAVVALVPG